MSKLKFSIIVKWLKIAFPILSQNMLMRLFHGTNTSFTTLTTADDNENCFAELEEEFSISH